ncbi:MAG: hypothetical protein MI810_07455 [Flavobacteriales bacterium]|nr:hypothetical protein [Flavobacteriales bacterium]
MRLIITILCFFSLSNLWAQPPLLFKASAGPNFIFDKSAPNLLGASVYGSVGTSLGRTDQFQFEPTLFLSMDNYRSVASDVGKYLLERRTIGMNLSVNMALSKTIDLHAGIHGDFLFAGSTSYQINNSSGIFAVGNATSEAKQERVTAGFHLGAYYWFGKKKFFALSVTARQHASSVIKEDYLRDGPNGDPEIKFSKSSRPTSLLVGAVFKFQKR